jgi:hypothetical protein
VDAREVQTGDEAHLLGLVREEHPRHAGNLVQGRPPAAA